MKKKKKLQILKDVRAKQAQAEKLLHEQQMNVLETKLMEAELERMKEHLTALEERRDDLLRIRDQSSSADLASATQSPNDQNTKKENPEKKELHDFSPGSSEAKPSKPSREELEKLRLELENAAINRTSIGDIVEARNRREELIKKRDELRSRAKENEEK